MKNAGFKNTKKGRRKAMKRMLNGESFVWGQYRLTLSNERGHARNPFRLVCGIVNEPIDSAWGAISEWLLEEPDWDFKDSLPWWCSAWDDDIEKAEIRLIHQIDNLVKYKYIGDDAISAAFYQNAEPFSAELNKLLNKEFGK